jgi:hypothetical protein
MSEDLAAELEWVARHLRVAGELDLRKDLTDAVTASVKDIPKQIRDGLRPRLPDPYADTLNADLSITVSKRYSASNPGVTVRARTKSAKARKLRQLDRGVLKHPLFGNRRKWYTQAVTPGWFTGPAGDAKSRARVEIVAAMDRVTAEAMRRHP